MYFGGISPAAQELCAKHCDVFLMWPETEDRIEATMSDMAEKAAAHGRKIDFGFRSHVIVGDPDQVYAKLRRYIDLGIRAFILSGYPHFDECDLFARHVLPRLDTVKLNEAHGRLPKETPETPLTFGVRK
jgi:alkanesulfonate monooxygenase SsuD/methylene tetrahydromethanopterin reductase-like flavin-dependent oxidoreductase (luciferase family)